MAGNDGFTKPLSELDALRLEKLQLQAQLLNLQGERDALKTKRQLDETIAAFQQLVKELAERDNVVDWKLDLEQRRWVAPAVKQPARKR